MDNTNEFLRHICTYLKTFKIRKYLLNIKQLIPKKLIKHKSTQVPVLCRTFDF